VTAWCISCRDLCIRSPTLIQSQPHCLPRAAIVPLVTTHHSACCGTMLCTGQLLHTLTWAVHAILIKLLAWKFLVAYPCVHRSQVPVPELCGWQKHGAPTLDDYTLPLKPCYLLCMFCGTMQGLLGQAPMVDVPPTLWRSVMTVWSPSVTAWWESQQHCS
jgi:hypothetical protein